MVGIMQRTVLITGANRGLGQETARQMKEIGFQVILTSRDLSKGQVAAQKLDLPVYQLDITRPDDIQKIVGTVKSEYGRLDVLVNNAAIHPSRGTSLLNIEPETLQLTLETNSLAPLWLSRAFLPMMIEQNYGRIVNVSSGMSQIKGLNDFSSSYRLSKLLLNGITLILADAVKGKNILVNSVSPGWVRTDMGGQNAPRSLEQGGKSIVWAATLPDDGPNGGFFQDGKPISW